MYSFEPTAEQQMLVESVHRFAANELRGAARDADETGGLPRRAIDKGWELGLLQSAIPEEYGGGGSRSAVTAVLALEELAWGDLAAAIALVSPGLFGLPILIAGTDEQRRKWLSAICRDGFPALTAAMVEPRYDFDSGNLSTTARRSGEDWVLEGEKCLVPLAAEAEQLLVYAALEGRAQAFVVARGSPGLIVRERERYMGVRGLPTYTISLSGCSVARSDRLGGEDGHDLAPVLNASRVAVAAMAVGLGRAAYEYGLKYAKEREAFGEPIARRQAVAFMLAEMATEIEAARLMVWEAAWLLDQDRDATRQAYLAKITADDTALMCADRAVQILGGHGYIRDHPVEMWLRNARGFPVFEGMAIV